MLNLEEVTAIIKEHEEALGDEAMAAIGVALLEKDMPVDTSEIESLKAQLEEEKSGRAADKKEYVDRINKFIYGGDPGGEPPKDPEPENTVVEEKSFYERMYGED